MARSFNELRAEMSPERRKRVALKAEAIKRVLSIREMGECGQATGHMENDEGGRCSDRSNEGAYWKNGDRSDDSEKG